MLTIILFLLSNPQIDYTTDPHRVFARSDSVLACIDKIEYRFSFRGTGALANIIPVMEGMTSIGFLSPANHPLMFHTFDTMIREGAIKGITIPSSFVAAKDSIFFIDHGTSMIYGAKYTGADHEMFDFPPASLMMEYVLPSPFCDEISADSITVLAPVVLNGVRCHVFHVIYDTDKDIEAVWFLGMEDMLPRAVERIGYYGTASTPGGQLLEISSINLESSIPFLPSLPDSYTLAPWPTLLQPSTQAPEFFLADKDGFARRSTEFMEKPLLLCFFSSWNPSSLSALGLLKSMSVQYSEYIHAVGISIQEANDPWFRLSALGINFPILVFGEDIADKYNVHSVPALFLISSNGEILFSSSIVTDDTASEIKKIIETSI